MSSIIYYCAWEPKQPDKDISEKHGIRKQKVKPCLFMDGIIVYLKNLRESVFTLNQSIEN